MVKKLKWLLVIVLLLICVFMVTPIYSKYADKYSKTITIDIRKPNYTVVFKSNAPTGKTVSGTMSNQDFVYGEYQNLNSNAYSMDGYVFKSWSMWLNGNDPNFADGESVKNLSKIDNAEVSLFAIWDYVATPQITRTDFNTFTYSAVSAGAYYVSTSDTKPEAGNTAASNTFALNTWITATNTGDLTLSAGQTYYVWAKDAVTGGSVSENKSSITVLTLTRSQGTGTTLTTRYDSTSENTGTAYTDATKYVLNGTPIWAKSVANSGYRAATLKHGNTSMTAGGQSFTASTSEAITSTATANKVTITIRKDGSNWSDSGMNVALYSGTTSKYAYSVGAKSGATVVWTGVANGTYNVYAGKDSGNKTSLIDTGLDITVSNNDQAGTINYYSLTLVKGTGISDVKNGGKSTTDAKQYLYLNSGTQQSIAIDATVSAGYTWKTWTKTSGTNPVTFTAGTKSQNIRLGAGAVTLTANTNPRYLANESSLKVGDYVNYPVNYSNVTVSNKFDNTYTYAATLTGWRVLSVETNSNGAKYVRLVSAGIPLSYCHNNTSTATIANLTSGFLSTPINSTYTNETFRRCGIKDASGNTITSNNNSQLRNVFINKNTYTSSVTTLTLDDLTNVGGATLESDGLSYTIKKNKGLFQLSPASGHSDEVKHAAYYLATRKKANNLHYLWTVARQSGEIVYTYNEQGVRPVVVLKTNVKTSGENANGVWQLVP